MQISQFSYFQATCAVVHAEKRLQKDDQKRYSLDEVFKELGV